MAKDYSFQITKNQYDYLIPIYGNSASGKLLCSIDRKIEKYYFIGSNYDYIDLLNRCKYLD